MKKLSLCAVLFAVIAICFLGCQGQPSNPMDATLTEQSGSNTLAKATVNHSEDKAPVGSFGAYIPCANGGSGEWAVVTNAELHVVTHTVYDAGGGLHVSGHFQPIRNWDGIGQVTGDVYQATGLSRENFNFDLNDGLPYEETFVNNLRWIGPGPGNNLLIHTTFHITFNANGTVTANVLNASTDCK
jgi:hypothetical protein